MTPSDKLREIAETLYPYIDYLPPDGQYANLMDWYRNRFIDMLTALISEHYYPKEFVEWVQYNTDHDGGDGKWYVYKAASEDKICFYYNLDELFNYWKENER